MDAPVTEQNDVLTDAPSRLTFGLVCSEADTRTVAVDGFLSALGEQLGASVERRDAPTYEALAVDVREGRVDLAWLPPIAFIRLADEVSPLGSFARGGQTSFTAALVVRADARIRDLESLRGLRAGWVDPWSAAGFVLPRMKLALLGVDPRGLFRTEHFLGSHHEALRALVDGACDVVGTYARSDGEGNVTDGAWKEVDADVRVLATFGAIPPDVLALGRGAERWRRPFVGALRALAAGPSRERLEKVFGGSEFREGLAAGYESLRGALGLATSRGLFD